MSFLFRDRPEQRSISYQDVWGSGSDTANKRLNPLTLISVYAATALIADLLAATPWGAFRESQGVPYPVTRQPKLLTDPGMYGLDLYSWKHQCAVSMLLRGNAYGFIAGWDSRGVPRDVMWLAPQKVTVDETGDRPVYLYDGREIDRSALIHIPLYVQPGSVVGLSPVGLFKQQLELGAEAQNVGRNFFRRGMMPPSILRNTEKTLTPDQVSTIKRRAVAAISSSEPFVTGKDWEFEAVSLPAGEASFLQAMKASATQVAAIYRVPPEDIGGETSGTSLTYKNLEMDTARFNSRTLRPIATRVETVLTRYLLPMPEYVRFNLDAAARADLKTRYEAHKIAIDSGFKTRDEVRALEELPPLPTTTQLEDQQNV